MNCAVLAGGFSESVAYELEIFLIAEIGRLANGGPLVNATDGGEGCTGLRHSEERKLAVGQMSKAMWKDPAKRAEIVAAKNLAQETAEHRALRRDIARDIHKRPGIRERLSRSQLDRYADPVEREKTALATRLALNTPEQKARRAIRNYSEARQKHGPVSAEARAKMSASARRRHSQTK